MLVSVTQKKSVTGVTPAGEAKCVASHAQTEEDKLCALRDAIEPAWEQAEQGQVVPWDLSAVIRELDGERRVKDRA